MSAKAGHTKSESPEFSIDAVFDAIVPESRNLDVKDFLDHRSAPSGDENELQLHINIPQRNSIFLDEILNVYIVLRSPYFEEDILQSYISRLSLSLEVHVLGTKVKSSEDDTEDLEPVKDVISTHRVKETDDPLVVVGGSTASLDSALGKFIYVLWKIETHVARPKVRCSNPVVQFVPCATLRPLEDQESSKNSYMASGIPTSMNILQSLERDPEFKDRPPLLLASRLSKVVPAGALGVEISKELKAVRRRSLRIIPAINSRLRFSRLGMSSNRAKVLASLDFEISPFIDEEIILETVGLTLSDGHADLITLPPVLELPLKCHQRDEITFIYNLMPKRLPQYLSGKRTSPHTLSLSAIARIPLLNDNNATIKIHWRTTVDLTHLVRSHLRTPISLSSNPSCDITMTISGPEQVLVNQSFKWSVLLANRSKTRSLRLALIPIPKTPTSTPETGRPSTLTHLHQHKSILSSSSTTLASGVTKSAAPAAVNLSQGTEAVMDPHQLYTLTHPSSGVPTTSSAIDPTAIIVLSADVIVGPIPPGACQTAEMEFLVLRAGIISFDAIRVVDLDSREGLDVVWLPDIISVGQEQIQETTEDEGNDYGS